MARNYKTGLIITGDASGGIRAIQATDRELGQLNRGFERGSTRSKTFGRDVGSTSRELQLLRRAAAPVGAMLAGMFAARSLQNQIQFADELQKLNLRIGASTEALSQYSYVAKQSGVEFGQLTTAWQRQTRRINEAAQGTGVASKALETLNLSARELAGLAPEDQFERIAAAMQGVADEGQRVALAQKLWDSEGVRLVQIVNQGTDAIAAMRAEADRFGLTISQDTANAMAAYNDEVARLQAVAEGVSRQILAELVPAMTSGLQAVSAFVDRAGGAEAILDGLKVAATGVAAVMAGRYAGAIGIATAAKLAAIQQAVAYQLALARMAGVSGTAAASQIALAGAVRGASGAMALVGGPVGAAVIAAGAIYYFREELGLVKAPIEAVTSEVDALTNAINMNSEASLKNGIAQLTADLAELQKSAESANSQMQVLQMQGPGPGQSGVSVTGRLPGLAEASDATDEAEQKVANYTAAIGQLEAQLESLGKSSVTPVRNIAATSEASKEAKKAGEQHAAALAALRREMDPGMAEAEKFADRTATLTKALASGAMGAAEHGQAIAWATQQYLRAATGAEELEKQQQSLIQQYDRHRQRARQLRADLDGVNQMYRAGVIDGDQYARMVAEIRDEMERLAFDADPMAQEMARAWEEASKRIDETFSDAFAGAFDSFDDFADQLLDGFKRLLAELAYQATLRPIVVGFTGQMQGAMGMPGAGGGSIGGGIAQVGGNLRNGWQAAQQGFGNIAWGWGGASNTAYAGGWAGSATSGIGQSGFMGGSTANFQGMQGLAGAGAGFAGGWAGNQVFGSSEHGGTLSAIGGTVGAYWGPIGAAIGSFIGSGIGSLFGGSSSSPELNLRTVATGTMPSGGTGWEHHGDAYTSGVFGDIGFADHGTSRLSRQFPDGEHEFLEAIAGMDAMMASLAQSEEQFKAMESAARSWSTRAGGPQGIVDQLSDRTATILGAIDGEFGKFVASLDGGVEGIVATALIASEAMALLSASQERLGIRFNETARGAYESAFAIAELAGGLDNLAALQSSYYQAYFSEAERAAHLQEDLTQALEALGLALPDSRDGFRSLVEAQDLNTESGQEAYIALLQLAGGFDQLQTHIEGLGSVVEGAVLDLSPVRSAYQALQQSISAEQQVLRSAHQATTASIRSNISTINNSVRETEQVARSLGSTLSRMLASDPAAAEMQRRQAQSMLSEIHASGGLGSRNDLDQALATVAQPSEGLYGSFVDYQRDFYQTANVIAELEARAVDQLTIEERSLRALERQMSQANHQFEQEMSQLERMLEAETAQLEAMFGQQEWLQAINGSVLSMSDAIAALGDAVRRTQAEQRARDSAADRAFSEWIRTPGAAEYYELNTEGLPQFRDGGIASGPMSGYRVELHGTEAVIPLKGGAVPVRLSGAGDDNALLREIRRLNKKVERLEDELREGNAISRGIADHTSKSAREAERRRREESAT